MLSAVYDFNQSTPPQILSRKIYKRLNSSRPCKGNIPSLNPNVSLNEIFLKK